MSTVEAIRERWRNLEQTNYETVAWHAQDVVALLAVAEAAKALSNRGRVYGSEGERLERALDALDAQS